MPNMKQTESAVFEQRATVDRRALLRPGHSDDAAADGSGARGEGAGRGCSHGVHSVRVARAGFRVCAIDNSQTMLQEAQSADCGRHQFAP
jgi:hypothetical protein